MEYTLELSANDTFTVLYGETGVKVERSFQWLEMIGGFKEYKKSVEDFECDPSFRISQELIDSFHVWSRLKSVAVESRSGERSRQLCRLVLPRSTIRLGVANEQSSIEGAFNADR